MDNLLEVISNDLKSSEHYANLSKETYEKVMLNKFNNLCNMIDIELTKELNLLKRSFILFPYEDNYYEIFNKFSKSQSFILDENFFDFVVDKLEKEFNFKIAEDSKKGKKEIVLSW